MTVTKVDQRHRIVVDKHIRSKTNIKAGDIVALELLGDNSFKVTAMNFSAEKLNEDPAWKALHTPVKAGKYISPKRLERIMEEEIWRA